MFRGLLRSSKPVMLMTGLAAVLGISGTAYGAKLITGLDIRDGSITTVDLSKNTQAAFQGDKGDKGDKGHKGNKGIEGNDGAPGAHGITGAIGLTGVRGLTGETGPTGPAGADSTVAGPDGATGATGLQGDPGTPGVNAVSGIAYYYNVSPQTVGAEGDVVFDTNGFATTNGLTHAENTSPVTVFTNGIYKVSFSVSSAEVSVLGVYVNNVAVPGSTYQSNAINQQNTGQVVTAVSAESAITIKSTSAITLPGLSSAANASITVERVG
jgi:Collagen triple helix repeat (20 copies)